MKEVIAHKLESHPEALVKNDIWRTGVLLDEPGEVFHFADSRTGAEHERSSFVAKLSDGDMMFGLTNLARNSDDGIVVRLSPSKKYEVPSQATYRHFERQLVLGRGALAFMGPLGIGASPYFTGEPAEDEGLIEQLVYTGPEDLHVGKIDV